MLGTGKELAMCCTSAGQGSGPDVDIAPESLEGRSRPFGQPLLDEIADLLGRLHDSSQKSSDGLAKISHVVDFPAPDSAVDNDDLRGQRLPLPCRGPVGRAACGSDQSELARHCCGVSA